MSSTSLVPTRPYKKNDNAHIEQKNWTFVRQLFSYDKLYLVTLMNDLYCNEWCQFQNQFCPTLKLKEKTRMNSQYRRRYELPHTPLQAVELMDSETLSEEQKQARKASHEVLDPFTLNAGIERKLIFQHVSVTPNERKRL